MAEITNSQSWTKIYRTVAAGASSLKTVLRTLKDDLITAGFTHVASCDASSTSTETDLWDSDSDLTWAAGSSAHSWIVLANSNIVSDLQICIDLNFASTISIKVLASMSSGFTGGSTTVRPTATDEIIISKDQSSYYWGASVNPASQSTQYNIFYCSDSIRVYFAYGGTTAYGYWCFDKLLGAPTWIDYPIMLSVSTSAVTPLARVNLQTNFSYLFFNDLVISVILGGIVVGTTTLQDLGNLDSGDYNSEWPTTEVFVCSSSLAGIFGYLTDMWHVVDNLSNFDYFPGDGSKDQVIFNDIAQGSDGSTVSW